jgi:hypothetical protein
MACRRLGSATRLAQRDDLRRGRDATVLRVPTKGAQATHSERVALSWSLPLLGPPPGSGGFVSGRISVGGMASKRSNPKKNKAARRRPVKPSGLRRAQLGLEQVHRVLMGAPPEALPLVAVAAVWLWNMSEDGQAAAHCVDGCLTLHYALAEYGIRSSVEAVGLRVHARGRRTEYGNQLGPRYNPDGSFDGHTVLVVPDAGRFIDPTVQQYAEVPSSEKAVLPVMAQLPVRGGLGSQPLGIDRGDHQVVYLPLPAAQRQAWRSPAVTANEADYRPAGEHLAANVLAMLGIDPLRARTARSPYPRLRALLAAVEGTEPVADSQGFRFLDPATGSEIRLADIPDRASQAGSGDGAGRRFSCLYHRSRPDSWLGCSAGRADTPSRRR